MPMQSEHSARLRDPDDFDPNSYRRTEGGTLYGKIKVPKTISIIWGKLKGKAKPDDPPLAQALRFPTKNWTEAEARKWLKDNGVKFISFEPASKTEESRSAKNIVTLSQPHALAVEGVVVDEVAGVLRNVSFITRGEAIGHPFVIDDVTLNQVAEQINKTPKGVKCRLTHPGWDDDGIMITVGRAKNSRVVGAQTRGDIEFGAYAKMSPSGDLKSYLLEIAKSDPEIIGLSISCMSDESEERKDENDIPLPPALRIAEMLAVDFVGDPGANPNGLLSEGKEKGDGDVPSEQSATLSPTKSGEANMDQVEKTKGQSADENVVNLESKADAPDKSASVKTDMPVKEAVKNADDGTEAAEKALAADRQRRKDILALADGDKPAVNLDTARQWADDGVSIADAKRLAEMASKMTPIAVGRVDGGEDRNISTLAAGISDALLLRAGHGTGMPNSMPLMTFDPITGLAERDENGKIKARKPSERALLMRRMPVPELARQYLGGLGVSNLSRFSADEVIDLASCRRPQFPQRLREAGGSIELAMSTSDFPYILADALGKVFLGGYNLAPSTWALWCRRMTARDFKDIKLLNLSEAPALTVRPEGAEIKFGTLTESRETVALVEYTSGLVFTRRMQINDDLGVFRDGGAQSLGAMARYKEDDVVYAILTANAALADGVALFHTTHANISSGSAEPVYAVAAPGVHPTVVALFLESEQSPVLKQEVQWDTDDLKVAVRHSVAAKAVDYRGMYLEQTGTITVAVLAAVLEAMATQTAPNGAYMNLRPAYLLCPAGVSEVTWAQLVGSSVDPSKYNATPNPFFNKLTVIGEPRLNVD